MLDVIEKISDSATANAIRKISALITAGGGRAYLVGGSVRDALLGENPHDLDVEVHGIRSAELIEILSKEFKLNLVGSSFGVIKINSLNIDISLPRRENKIGSGHRGFLMEFDPDMTLKEASARRDFTINSIMFDLHTKELIDPHNGLQDIRKKILRHVSSHFSEDPLRVLRGMQFCARFNLTASAELIAGCQSMTPENLAIERLGEEWKKLLLKGVKPSRGLEFLRAAGWVEYYPELKKLIGCQQYKKWHPEGDVWQHTLHSLDAGVAFRDGDENDNLVMMLAILCHDFGKPATTVFELDGRITSRNHEDAGTAPTEKFITGLWRNNSIAKAVIPLVKNHLKPYTFFYQKASDRAFRRLSAKVGRLDLLAKVALADSGGRPPTPMDTTPITWFLEKCENLKIASEAPTPIIQGKDIIALGIAPGKQIGELVRLCYNAQLDGKFFTMDEAIFFLKSALKGK